MKKEVHKLSESDLLKLYPIKGETNGWFYRTVETSNNAWMVEGSDAWGRKISLRGNDPQELLKEAEIEAKQIDFKRNAT